MIRVALAQMEVADGDWKTNVDEAARLIADAPDADLYVLPELWTSGYAYDRWHHIAEELGHATVEWYRKAAAARGATIAGSNIALNHESRLVNRLWCISANETVFYDKTHLFPPLREPELLVAGNKRQHAIVAGATLALSICYDLRYPVMYRQDARDGAQVFLVSAEWPASRADALRTLCRARAIENQAFLVLCNRTGTARDGLEFKGGSMVVSPLGEVLLDLGEETRVDVLQVDTSVVALTRKAIPVLAGESKHIDY
jgi:omega-amidase